MRLQDHFSKISWTFADKTLFIVYGFVSILQIKALLPQEYGLFFLLNALQTYISTLSDGFALQAIIKFGADVNERKRVNLLAFFLHSTIYFILPLIVFILREPFANLFHEPELVSIGLYLPVFCLLAFPRLFCIKFLYRDVQPKEILIVNAVWFGVMTALTFYFLSLNSVFTFQNMVSINFFGMGASSIAAIWFARKQLVFSLKGSITLREMFEFGFFQFSSSAVANLVKQLDGYLLKLFFPTEIIGTYGAAKTLFRAFDEAFGAVGGLVYPGSVRLHAQQRNAELLAFISKAASFMFVTMIGVVLVFESGLGRIVISFLLPKYTASVGFMNIMILSTLAMPLTILSSQYVVFGKMRLLLWHVVMATFAGLFTFALVGMTHNTSLIPFGLVVYNVVFAIFCFIFVRDTLGFQVKMLFRAIPDTISFLKKRFSKGKS